MNINDYLIDQEGNDWGALLRDWVPPLPPSFTLWLVNRFGDAFVVDDDDDSILAGQIIMARFTARAIRWSLVWSPFCWRRGIRRSG